MNVSLEPYKMSPGTSDYGEHLIFWRDLTPFPKPHKAPDLTSPRVLIIGGGVMGLVNAWTLLDKGYRITILSKEWASYGDKQRLTSQIAGALWEFPPAVCGQHSDPISLQHSKRWSMVAYHIWDAIAASDPTARRAGVRMKSANFFFPVPVEQLPAQKTKMLEIISRGVRGFRHDPAIINERRINPDYGVVDAYEHVAPVIDTDKCMYFLKSLVTSKGATLVTRTIKGDLFLQESVLRAEYSADAIINCTGLAGTELAGDRTCYPIRGALLRVRNDGRDFPKLDHVLSISANVHSSNEIVFLVPRNDNILLIGGVAEAHKNNLDLTLNSPIIKRMRGRAEAFLPDLKNARLDDEYPLAQGVRPFRQGNVRVERELRSHSPPGSEPRSISRIVHCYGHGGSGWSLSFGCAADVLELVKEALSDMPPEPMRLEGVVKARTSRL